MGRAITGRKPATPIDELAKIGVYTIADTKTDLRMQERKKFNEALDQLGAPMTYTDGEKKDKAITDAQDRLREYRRRLIILYNLFKTVAVPYMRSMDQDKSHFAWGLKVLEHLYSTTMTYITDFERIFTSDMSNKEEVMAGVEFWIVVYMKMWIEAFYNWAYGGMDMTPNYSITVHSVPQERKGFQDRSSGIDFDKLQDQDKAGAEA